MTGLTEAERRHVEDLGADVVDWVEERVAIMMHDGHVPERQAWRMAYERACKAHGARAVPAQAALFARAG
jgi:hypothetical protein